MIIHKGNFNRIKPIADMAAKTRTSAIIHKKQKQQTAKKASNIYEVCEPFYKFLRFYIMAVFKIDPQTREIITSKMNIFFMCGTLLLLSFCVGVTVIDLFGVQTRLTKAYRLSAARSAGKIINIFYFSSVIFVVIRNFAWRNVIGDFLKVLDDFDKKAQQMNMKINFAKHKFVLKACLIFAMSITMLMFFIQYYHHT